MGEVKLVQPQVCLMGMALLGLPYKVELEEGIVWVANI